MDGELVKHDVAMNLMRRVYDFASVYSKDPSTQNAAFLIDGEILDPFVFAANRFPTGVSEQPERWERPLKYSYVCHAEAGVIYKAASLGHRTTGQIMVCPWVACTDCAKAIIESRLKGVVCHLDPLAETRFGKPVSTTWRDSVAIGIQMMREAGVILQILDEPVGGGQTILFNGGLVEV